MCITNMTAEMQNSTCTGDTPTQNDHTQVDDALLHDEYVQMALYSLMKNLCSDMEECQSVDSPSVPSTPVDVRDAFQYKLEQAADSVKTDLLYAVREEVDAIRGKLSDLEMKIYRLEVENRLLLREYVPPEILERLGDGIRRKRSACCPPPPSVIQSTDQLSVADQNTSPIVGSC